MQSNKVKTIPKITIKELINASARHKEGLAPLLLAAANDHAETHELLIELGAGRLRCEESRKKR